MLKKVITFKINAGNPKILIFNKIVKYKTGTQLKYNFYHQFFFFLLHILYFEVNIKISKVIKFKILYLSIKIFF